MITEDKGKVQSFDKSDMNGVKPYGNIGSDRDADRKGSDHTSNIVSKLNKNRKTKSNGKGSRGQVADGSTEDSGAKANGLTSVLNGFSNRRKLPL